MLINRCYYIPRDRVIGFEDQLLQQSLVEQRLNVNITIIVFNHLNCEAAVMVYFDSSHRIYYLHPYPDHETGDGIYKGFQHGVDPSSIISIFYGLW